MTQNVSIESIEKFERCRHLLYFLTNELGLHQASWQTLADAYMKLAEEIGVDKIAEEYAQKQYENADATYSAEELEVVKD